MGYLYALFITDTHGCPRRRGTQLGRTDICVQRGVRSVCRAAGGSPGARRGGGSAAAGTGRCAHGRPRGPQVLKSIWRLLSPPAWFSPTVRECGAPSLVWPLYRGARTLSESACNCGASVLRVGVLHSSSILSIHCSRARIMKVSIWAEPELQARVSRNEAKTLDLPGFEYRQTR